MANNFYENEIFNQKKQAFVKRLRNIKLKKVLIIINYHIKTMMLVRRQGVRIVELQLLGGVTLGVTTKIVIFFVRNLVQSLVFQNYISKILILIP